ncbi:MAG TPA: NAD-dependent epimerase/dehydratase family protein, partial [Actinomycetota bacterium]|nr:NAD-dependent epimerase/dehydratase family protein [Actinomycetota bacterium]
EGSADGPMDYLITGGAGFIGSHLADALLARGDHVVALDDGSTGSVDNVRHLLGQPGFELREGTVLDETLVGELAGRADVIVHLAAAVGVKLIVEQPLRSLITNIRGTENVLEAAALADARVLVASTSEIYGKNGSGPLPETSDRVLGSPFVARWSYSEAKAIDEILAHAYWKDRGTEAIVARFFNCVGPRQTGAYGMVVPSLVRQALAGQDVTVFGTGEQRRCVCHVLDTVAAVVALLDHPDSPGDPYNVGALNEVSMNELAEAIVARTGSSSQIVHVPYEVAYEAGFEDMERRVPDIGRISALTGWSPKRTLDDILDDVIEHQRLTAAR